MKKTKFKKNAQKITHKPETCLNSGEQVCNLPKLAFKKSIRKALCAALESEEDYIEAPNLLFKSNLHFT